MRRIRSLAALAALLLLPLDPAVAYPRPGQTELVSVTDTGAEGQGWSWLPDISADGRFIVYESDAQDLVQDDANGVADIFWRDRLRGETRRASTAPDGSEVSRGGQRPVVSDDGRFVGFFSYASELVPDDTNNQADCFVKDMLTGAVERVSVATDGTQSDGSCFGLEMDATGRHVVFRNTATNLVPGDTNAVEDFFIRDRLLDQTRRISVSSDGTQADDHSTVDPEISADGSVVTFYSTATNLTPDGKHAAGYIYAHDVRTGATERVVKASDGSESNGGAIFHSVSGDGRYVVFASGSSNLVPNDTNVTSDVFLYDRVTKATRRITVDSAGRQSDALVYTPDISHDGRFVSFVTKSTNLVPGDTNAKDDVFVHDVLTGTTELISLDHQGGPAGESVTGRYNANEITGTAVMARNGRHVVFSSQATDLLEEPTTAWRGIFVRDRGPATGVRRLEVVRDGDAIGVAGDATFGGAVAATASDPADDGAEGAAELGAELTGAEVVERVEAEDLFVRLRVAELPGARAPVLDEARGSLVPSVAGAPAVTYGLRFATGGSTYEVRAVAAPGPEATTQSFELARCATTCERIGPLAGGIGTVGHEISVAVPRSLVGPGPLTTVQAFADLGRGEVRARLDEVALPDAARPLPAVRLLARPEATGDAWRSLEVAPTLGAFSGVLEVPGAAGRRLEVVAEACLGSLCAETRRFA